MKKTIKSEYTSLVFDIEPANWSIKFYDYQTRRHHERRVWHNVHGSDIYVQLRGKFVNIVTERFDRYDPWTSTEYAIVSAEEAAEVKYNAAREWAKKAEAAEAATGNAAFDYDRATVEEQAREAHFAAMAAKNSAEAAREYAEQAGTVEAFVFVEMALEEAERARQFAADAADIAENYTEPEQATERKSAEPEPAAQISEATKNASRAAADAEKAAREVVEAPDICDADAADNRAQMAARYAAEQANRYDADEVTRAEADNAARAAQLAREALTARVLSGITEADADAANSSDYAERLTREAVQKAGGNLAELEAAQRALIIRELISDEETRAQLEVFAAAHQWSPQETRENVTHTAQISAANAAARHFLAVYQSVTGHTPSDRDAIAAARVARDEITGTSDSATTADHATVCVMVDIIAAAAKAEAEQAAKETKRTAAEAAAALLDAYRRAFCGETSEEQEQAAYRVAAAELIPEGQRPAGYEAASTADYDAVSAMVDRIASQIYGIVILDADGTEAEVMSYQTKAERDEAERRLNMGEYGYMGNMGEFDYYREPDRAAKADAAADALTREYRSIVNDHPTTTPDPCTREAEAARRVARHDIAHELGSTREDREIVSYMVEAIALQAAEEYAANQR